MFPFVGFDAEADADADALVYCPSVVVLVETFIFHLDLCCIFLSPTMAILTMLFVVREQMKAEVHSITIVLAVKDNFFKATSNAT